MSRESIRRVLVAYDVSADQRRERLAHILERHGDRVQYSVFVVDASPSRLIKLRRELETVMVGCEDSILICDLGPLQAMRPGQFTYLGLKRHLTSAKDMIV